MVTMARTPWTERRAYEEVMVYPVLRRTTTQTTKCLQPHADRIQVDRLRWRDDDAGLTR
jgi:hypothetical protein